MRLSRIKSSRRTSHSLVCASLRMAVIKDDAVSPGCCLRRLLRTLSNMTFFYNKIIVIFAERRAKLIAASFSDSLKLLEISLARSPCCYKCIDLKYIYLAGWKRRKRAFHASQCSAAMKCYY